MHIHQCEKVDRTDLSPCYFHPALPLQLLRRQWVVRIADMSTNTVNCRYEVARRRPLGGGETCRTVPGVVWCSCDAPRRGRGASWNIGFQVADIHVCMQPCLASSRTSLFSEEAVGASRAHSNNDAFWDPPQRIPCS
jgi:hypothetical protein